MKRVLPDLEPTLRLRLLATSDLHGHLRAWDYYRDRPLVGSGLAPVASLIRAARAEVANSLYFDNGDLIEGSPLAEYALHAAGTGSHLAHPMIAALNGLGCDAATLGNHEFSYGTGFLQGTLAGAGYPVVCANIFAAGQAFVRPWVMLEREFADESGQMHQLRVGVLGLTPPQVLDWDRAVLGGQLQAEGMVEAARRTIPLMRAAGVDVVVALAHTGLGARDGGGTGDNLGWQLAELPGLDALILGHEHQVFPLAGQEGVLGGVPAVMPGAFGSHLGVVDLVLRRGARGWRVEGGQGSCRTVAMRGAYGEAIALVDCDAATVAQAEDSHQATRQFMGQAVGQTDVPLHSYFAVAQPTAMQALIAEAKAAHLAEMLVGTRWEDLPILSSVAPFKAGGRAGPDYFTSVSAGPLLLRHAADLYVHPNRFAAIVITGAGLRTWLERAATAYAQVIPAVQDQPLLDARFPATCLEMIAGLSYVIDLAEPARYDAPTGHKVSDSWRIRDLQFQGQPIEDDMRFALATNSHRLGMLQKAMPGVEVIADGTGTLYSRDVLLRHLARRHGATSPAPLQWSFRPIIGARVTLDTAPAALGHLVEIADFAPENLGLTEAGFLRFRLHL